MRCVYRLRSQKLRVQPWTAWACALVGIPHTFVPKHRKAHDFAPQGKDAIKFLEGLVVGDISGIPDGQGSLSVFTNEQGGIIDDTVITKARRSGHLPACLHYLCSRSRQIAEAG